ncbi:MAG: Fic family protein [Actinobacteria bacterium]|nr:Fic family protein [Actinomycetota bacterium]MCO5299170.1 Fic family protein [Candidatus Nanopelagicales bacterium]MCB9429483.1 Fic family protein [Actinomycetota bacterium]HPE11374.1 Fic family protein [Actinomycetota bacterium]HPJ18921.1 Fic family protein [Actinomycetota bacterium]
MDVFAAVTALPEVEETADSSRAAFDAMLWDRKLRGAASELSRRSALAGAASSAGIDGIEIEWKVWEAGQAGDDTAMGRAASGVVAMYAELPSLGPVWERAPLQALAKMHTLVAVPVTPEDVGRPRTGEPQDPLHLGTSPTPQEVPARLTALAQRITAPTSAPALVVAAVVHAELMTLQPFTYGSGLVARAVDRLVLAGRGIDPDNWSVPEAGVHTQGRTTYARTLRGYATGQPEAVAAWVRFYCAAVAAGTEGLAALVQ